MSNMSELDARIQDLADATGVPAAVLSHHVQKLISERWMPFTAAFATTEHAKSFEENANRTTGALNIVRNGRTVTFDAYTQYATRDGGTDDWYGELRLTVHYYGGPRATLNNVSL